MRLKARNDLGQINVNGIFYNERSLIQALGELEEKIGKGIFFIVDRCLDDPTNIDIRNVIAIVKGYEIIGREIYFDFEFLESYKHIGDNIKNFGCEKYGILINGIGKFDTTMEAYLEEISFLNICMGDEVLLI